ncbi:hypothetical protein, partial [Pseudomonas sp. IT-P171]|uniref:hypothetical protein n=1 Tax=Pseudomonas sp. IT-P171 TaxID=3026453 RepID=UPI0039DF9148
GAATQPSASKLARHKGMHDSRARLNEQHCFHSGAFLCPFVGEGLKKSRQGRYRDSPAGSSGQD